jgi:hypothetical protein
MFLLISIAAVHQAAITLPVMPVKHGRGNYPWEAATYPK